MNINSRTSKINFTGFASGAVASFTGLREALTKVKVNASDVSECNVVRCGKNILLNRRTTATISGITYTVNADGSVFVEGGQTASGTSIFNLISDSQDFFNLPEIGLKYDVSYVINGCPPDGSGSTYRFIFRSGGQAQNIEDIGNGASFNISSSGNTLAWCPCIVISNGYTIPSGGLLFKPMIRPASILDDTYEPYTSDTYTIAVGQTVTQIEQRIGINNIFVDDENVNDGTVEVYYVTI